VYRLVSKIRGKWKGLAGSAGGGRPEEALKLLDSGFHGDRYLLAMIDSVVKDCTWFIETGTNAGSTLAYMARTYNFLRCLSCEPDKQAFSHAVKNTSPYENVLILNEMSQELIRIIKKKYGSIFHENVLFWLDAHGYGFDWPLRSELEFITSHFENAFIFIDDFKVPDLDCFAYHTYKDQVCSFDYVRASIRRDDFSLYYPYYTDRTSAYHPLTGWGLIAIGGEHRESIVPEGLKGKIRRAI